MNPNWIILPVLLHILLTLLLLTRLGIVKAKATATNSVNRQRAALHHDAWPNEVLQVSNNIRNQFETPMLFYALSLCLYILSEVTIVTLTLSSLYVLSRYLHAYIHITSNYVPWRLRAFTFGALILVVLLMCALKGVVSSLHISQTSAPILNGLKDPHSVNLMLNHHSYVANTDGGSRNIR